MERIQSIDGTAFIESNRTKIEYANEIPDGDKYKKLFNADDQIFRGRVYIGCELHSSIPVVQLKWSPIFGLMDWLKKENIHLSEQRYETLAEASIGFIPYVNPAVVLRSDLREKIDACLETIELKEKEEDILEEFTNEEDKDTEDTILPLLNRENNNKLWQWKK